MTEENTKMLMLFRPGTRQQILCCPTCERELLVRERKGKRYLRCLGCWFVLSLIVGKPFRLKVEHREAKAMMPAHDSGSQREGGT